MLKFTEEHEWLELQDDEATVGITEFAVSQLGDIVFVELPEVGSEFNANEDAAVVESVKAASDIYAPVSGTVTEVNSAIADSPELVNEDPEGDGWFFRLKLSDPSECDELLDADEYRKLIS